MEPEPSTQLLDLPTEIILEIINFLAYKDKLALSLVNQELFIMTKESIEKQSIVDAAFPFPELGSFLTRSYNTVSVRYWDFVYEFEKADRFMNLLKYGPKALQLQVYIDYFKDSDLFERSIESNRNLKTIQMNNYYAELIEYCLSKFPRIELQVLKATLSVKQPAFKLNADYLENLELFNPEEDHIDEIDLIRTLSKFRNLTRLQTYHLKTSQRPSEVIQLMKDINLLRLQKMKRLDLYYTEEIAEYSSFLSLFQNLESLMCHFQEPDIVYGEDSFKFARLIYANNEKTLKVLSLKIFGLPQIMNFLPNNQIRLRELIFFSCDSNDYTHNFLVQLLNQQALHLKKLSLEGITIDNEIFQKIVSLENLDELSLQACEIEFPYADIMSLKKLRISFSSISRDCFKSILGNEQLQSNINVLHLDDFQPTYSEEDRFELFLFPSLKCLVYKTYGDAEEVQHFIKQLQAPLLEILKYGFVWNTAPSFQKFSNLKILVVQALYKKFDDIKLLLTLEKLEILDIFVDLIILPEVLETLSAKSDNLKIFKIKCHSKTSSKQNIDKLAGICDNFIKNKPYQLKMNVNQNNNTKFVQIINLKLTVCVHMEFDIPYYYEDLFNSYFDF